METSKWTFCGNNIFAAMDVLGFNHLLSRSLTCTYTPTSLRLHCQLWNKTLNPNKTLGHIQNHDTNLKSNLCTTAIGMVYESEISSNHEPAPTVNDHTQRGDILSGYGNAKDWWNGYIQMDILRLQNIAAMIVLGCNHLLRIPLICTYTPTYFFSPTLSIWIKP